MPIAMINLTHMFSRPQLEQVVPALTLYLPADLPTLGYAANEVAGTTQALAAVLDAAIARPGSAVGGDGLTALQRFAQRSGGQLVFLPEVSAAYHLSEKSHSIAQFLGLLAAAGGVYGVNPPRRAASSRGALIDPSNGEVLRALEDHVRQ